MQIIKFITRISIYAAFFVFFDWVYRAGAEHGNSGLLFLIGALAALLMTLTSVALVAFVSGRREGRNWQSNVARLGEDGAARRSRLTGEWIVAGAMFGALPFGYVLGGAFPNSIAGPFLFTLTSYLLTMLVVFVPFVGAMDRQRNKPGSNEDATSPSQA